MAKKKTTSKDIAKPKGVRLTGTRVAPAVLNEMRQLAKKKKTPLAALVRAAVIEYLENQSKAPATR